jgi:hypothetical protein
VVGLVCAVMREGWEWAACEEWRSRKESMVPILA